MFLQPTSFGFTYLESAMSKERIIEKVPIYNAFNIYCRELAPGTVSLTGDRAQGDNSKH